MKISSKKILLLLIIITFASCVSRPKRVMPSIKPPSPIIKDVNVALVLGGGGSKAYAHAGVLSVLEKHNIPIDLIVGTSAGSGIGALYADTKDANKVKELVLSLKKENLIDYSLMFGVAGINSLNGFSEGNEMLNFFSTNLHAKDFKDLKIPLIAVATDINQNNAYIFDSGEIAPAILASSAIPPVFSPVNIYGHTLVDGGVVQPVPVEIAQIYKPKVIIAVNISAPATLGVPANMLNLFYRAVWITYYKLSISQSMKADIEIRPDTYGQGMFDDGNGLAIYHEGERAASAAIPSIKAKLKKLGIALIKEES